MVGSRESSRTTSEPPGSYELSCLFPLKQGQEAESSYEPGGSDVVRELSREPAMFQIGVQGEVLKERSMHAEQFSESKGLFPLIFFSSFLGVSLLFPFLGMSGEPKVRLQGYGYSPFCSHSSRCLAVLV